MIIWISLIIPVIVDIKTIPIHKYLQYHLILCIATRRMPSKAAMLILEDILTITNKTTTALFKAVYCPE